jgi:transposase InsO family protein
VQTDNGAEFQSQFHWHAQALDIRHVYIRPRTPHLNGKVERRPGVLSASRPGRRQRRHPSVQREAARVGGLLQLPSSPRRAGRPDAVRTLDR